MECIQSCNKDKIIQYIEDNGLPVVNIFKTIATEDNLSEKENGKEDECTPRFEDCKDESKISHKEVAY